MAESGTPGAQVRPVSFRPWFEKHEGHVCHGVMLHVTNPLLFRPVATYLSLISHAHAQAPEHFRFRTEPYEFETTIPAFDLLTGSDAARSAITEGRPASEVVELVAPVDGAWREVVKAAELRLERARA